MQIKPPIRTSRSKSSVCSWIIEKFPLEYDKMMYIEPFVGNGSILLNKLKSVEEVCGDLNKNIIYVWKALRDENKSFRSKLIKLKYNEKFFEFIKNKKVEKDYFKEAFKEFILCKMSRLGLKETFDHLDRKKSNRLWKETSENIASIEDRIKDVYFLSKHPLEVVQKFDNQNAFCFCCPPPILEEKSELTTDEYVNLSDLLLSFRGKVMLYGNNCSFYKRIFKDWKMIKVKSTTKKSDCLWINF